MNANTEILKEEYNQKPMAMHPKKFALWLFMVSLLMMFAALTSAFLVARAEPRWKEFEMPVLFLYSTVIIVLSSVTMQWAFIAAKKDNFSHLKTAILLTTVFGVLFLVMQWIAWGALLDMGVYFSDPKTHSGSFMYLLTGLHALHIISALIFLLVVLVVSFKGKVHSKNMLRIETCATYWHFLGVLWIYLYGFLLINN